MSEPLIAFFLSVTALGGLWAVANLVGALIPAYRPYVALGNHALRDWGHFMLRAFLITLVAVITGTIYLLLVLELAARAMLRISQAAGSRVEGVPTFAVPYRLPLGVPGWPAAVELSETATPGSELAFDESARDDQTAGKAPGRRRADDAPERRRFSPRRYRRSHS